MFFILGAAGFVGSAVVRACERAGREYRPITRNNYAEHIGQTCDVFINAAGNSRKYLAEESPLADFDMNVRSTLQSLVDFPARRYVYLSTIDVYNDVEHPGRNRETEPIEPSRLSRYGLGKYLGELLVQKYAHSWLILRVGGMVGPGLWKNPIFDLLNKSPLRVHPESRYQYLHTDDAARIMVDLAEQSENALVVNVCGDGVISLAEVQQMLGLPAEDSGFERQHYEINIDRLKSRVAVPSSRETVRRFLLHDYHADAGSS